MTLRLLRASTRLATAWLVLLVFCVGCAGPSVSQRRLAKYVPDVSGRKPWDWEKQLRRSGTVPGAVTPGAAATNAAANVAAPIAGAGAGETPSTNVVTAPVGPARMSRALRRGDKLIIYLRGIPKPEDIVEIVDGLGFVSLPYLPPVKVVGITTSEAETRIERAYIDGGYYSRITVIVVAQEEEYFVRGEVKRPGRYALAGDTTLLQAIVTAGGYTDFANPRKIRVSRGEEIEVFNGERIEQRKDPDPLIEAGDIVIVPRGWFR